MLWNGFANMAAAAGRTVTVVRGQDATVYDEAGRSYLDAIASLWYCNIGHGQPELADIAAAQMREIAGFQTFEVFSNGRPRHWRSASRGWSRCQDAKVFFTPGGGSDAIDTAAKLSRAYWRAAGQPGKQVIIGRTHAYHGMNAYGTSLGGIPANSDPFGPMVTAVEHVAWDDPGALAKQIEQAGPDRVAAFFCEPVIGAGGVYFPPDGYLTRCNRYAGTTSVLFVADEVITGFGRTGEWFASVRYGLDPDMMIVAKGLTSGYLPLGAVVAGPRVRSRSGGQARPRSSGTATRIRRTRPRAP